MLKNYLTSALRNLSRHRVFSAINILGLAGSMAVFILITLYVRLIAGTDKFHENHNRIFRIERPEIHNMAAPIGPFLYEQYPEVEAFIRMGEVFYTSNLFQFEDKTIKLENIWLADSSFFNVFSFPLVKGDESEVLLKPDAIVLSQSAAKRIFGDENPVGKSVSFQSRFTLQVTGVMEDFPVNSSIQADAIIAFDFYKTLQNDPLILESFQRWNYNTFLLLNSEANVEQLTENINQELSAFILRNLQLPNSQLPEFVLTPLPDIYFKKYANHDGLKHGSRSNISIAIAVSIIILLLAIINFTNLSTAQATYRTKEVGIRKTLGASKPLLVQQHLLESIITAYISIFIAVILVEQLLNVFSSLVNTELTLSLFDGINLAIILLSPLFMGLLAGSYPAFYISSFSPFKILSGEKTGGRKGGKIRRILILAQFVTASVLIIFTFHVNRQVNYLINKDLGINTENRLVVETSPELLKNQDVFINELWANPDIINATLHASSLGNIVEGWGMDYEGQNMQFRVQLADSNYFSTLNAKIIEGKTFKNRTPSDSVYEVIVNKCAVEKYNLSNPVGMEIFFMNNMKLRVVGVVNDFHYESLHKPIDPLMVVNIVYPNFITINYIPGKTQETIRFVEDLWMKFSPNSPLTYTSLNDDLAKLYVEEARLKRLFQGFTIVAIFIALIGLFGLSSFDIGKRTREIGIRKVMGSSSSGLVLFLVWQFVRMVVLSLLFAFPIAWWLINKWLQNFITPAGHSIYIYIGSGILVTLIAILTVIYHSTKAANTNPANVLKYE
ncbi:MAG: hypothetical protein CVT98_01720 [Bacteroidetes bacterium HGW-Bacteroidetes-15]|nr:MAG: hypothetical protein CVT98_01720 [Bacteroidetes bacterium HGW-Bacteroidetes-15]